MVKAEKEAKKAPAKKAAKSAEAKAAAPKKEKAPKKAKSAGAPVPTGGASAYDYSILLSPVVTEKSSLVGTHGSAGGSTYVFRVDKKSNKAEIRAAIEKVFKVNVTAVRTASYMGKVKRTTRSAGRRAGFKKAYVSVREGQTISVVEGL